MSRPQKKIVVVCAREQHLELRRFLLWTHGYTVETAATAEEALLILEVSAGRGEPQDLVVFELPVLDLTAVVTQRIRAISPDTRTLSIRDHGASYDVEFVDVALPACASVAELLERIKVLVERKRGPKPGWRKLPVGAVRAMEHAGRKSA